MMPTGEWSRRVGTPRPAGRRPAPGGGGRATVIPFDHVARFELSGRAGAVQPAVVNVGPEGIFVAVAISYGFAADRAAPIAVAPADGEATTVVLGGVTLDRLPIQALVDGFRLAPDAASFSLADGGAAAFSDTASGRASVSALSPNAIPQELADRAFVRVRPEPATFSFLLSIVDSSTGRELQGDPMQSLASLGIANGERPFRPLAQPLAFVPRSTLRLQVIEQTAGTVGPLDVVLIGYKVLIGSGCPPEVAAAALRGITGSAPPGAARPGEGIIPFDYVAAVPLRGRPGRRTDTEIVINTEGAFVATAVGYGLAIGDTTVAVTPDSRISAGTAIDLNTITLSAFPVDALIDGVRLRPELVRLAVTNGALGTVSPQTLAGLFERLNRPEDARFRYAFTDTGSGHDWQNEAIDNVAGLGIASGKRPFKWLAWPMVFAPRATLSISIEEIRGRGQLYLTFQGYKVIGGASPMASGHRPARRHGR